MFYLETLLRTRACVGDRLSNSSEVREEPGYRRDFAGGKKNVVEQQKITTNPKKQTSQVNDFSTFLCMGRCKTLGSMKLFL